MVLLGFLLLMCAVTALAERIPLCRHLKEQGGPENIANCLCPVEAPTIINSLDPDNSGVERLVIFVYRKINTGEIVSFVPETQYQHQIPDFSEEYGTINDISHNTILVEMFEESPSKTIRKKIGTDKPEPIEQAESTNPSNKEPNEVVIVVDVQRPKEAIPGIKVLNENKKIDPWLIPVDNDSENQVAVTQASPLIEHQGNEATEIPSDTFKPYEYNPEHSVENDHGYYITPDGINDHQNSNEEDPGIFLNNNQHSYDSLPMYPSPPNAEQPEGNYEDHLTPEDEANKKIEEDSSKPNTDVHPPNPIEGTQVNDDNLESDEYADDLDPNVNKHTSHMPLKDSHGRIVGWTSHTIKHKTYWQRSRNTNSLLGPHWVKGNTVYNKNLINSQVNINKRPNGMMNQDYENLDEIPAFNYWLKEQLNITTVNGNKIPTSSDDLMRLQQEIRNILYQNHFIVTEQGFIVGHGGTTSLDNLKLQPILIGKSISKDRFLKHGSDIKIKIPSNTPFLEGLLLSMIKPPKVLGIVPLQITSLPQKLGPKEYKNEITIAGHVEPAGKKSMLKIMPLSHLMSFRKGSPLFKTNLFRKQRTGTPISGRSRYKTDFKHLRAALAAITKNKTKKKELVAGYLHRPKETPASEEVPDYRIIGGISATVSGTPLLNRGRSGYPQ